MTFDKQSRRHFVKQLGTAAGGAALSSNVIRASEQLAARAQILEIPEPMPRPVFPTLNRRTLGWLRFLWQKATTTDDWSSNGVPHPWWDRYTAPVVLSYGRFDLAYSTYAILLMADQTPAWREAYTRVVDGLASRYPTYWGAIDWLTQIGDDPKRKNYPPQVMNQIPERLRGRYNRIGWTANGIGPGGLQPDPIGADGNLFFRGWFNLVLSIYKYVSGDDKWARSFKVTGYGDEPFEWDHHRIAERLERQYRAHPEGPHCENTKIWFFCNSAAGLGLSLYDKVFAKQTHRAVENFLEYAKKNYIGVSKDGKLDWITSYYDPIVNHKANGGPAAGVATAFLVLPQDRQLAAFIYEAAANRAGWNNPRVPIRASSAGLLMARELSDHTAVARLAAAAEREYEPRFFGDANEKFGWWFQLNEGYPRGQQSAMMMVSEVGNGGDWLRAFEAPHLDKFGAPTVEGIDFPSLGVYQAWNDSTSGTLYVGTYPASADRRGTETSWRVTNIPNTDDVVVFCDGEPFKRFEVTAPNTIRIDTTVDTRRYEIVTGYRGAKAANAAREEQRNRQQLAGAAVSSRLTVADAEPVGPGGSGLFPAGGPTCPCCGA
ncbi:MAG: twin-arginine translocation signal domain-containing protein [Vicinamibacterales bacterium]